MLYRLAAWQRMTGRGRQFLSLKITPEDLKADAVEATAQPSSPQPDDLDDRIPF